uniref:CD82 antigen-like n=1 Tax=Hippocampus comes TaxID=109280 RepID=A0A3Q2XWE0_HIPCM
MLTRCVCTWMWMCVSPDELQAVGAGLMLIGTLVMVSSLVACLGARWENAILMLICMWGLLFLFLCCVGLLLLLLLSRGQIEEKADAAVAHMIRQYRGDGRQDGLLDDLQQHEVCCGLTGPSDWLQNSFVQTLNTSATSTLPCSCFGSPQRNLETAWCSQDPNVTHAHAIALANCTHTQVHAPARSTGCFCVRVNAKKANASLRPGLPRAAH